jgi:virulence-associated protein VapD
MNPKRLLNNLRKVEQEYYIFLAKECFSGFSNAEYNFDIYRYLSCYAWLFHSSEFFWKSLIILSNSSFDPKHEASETDMAKISSDLLSENERKKAYNILNSFPSIKQVLVRYGYYEKRDGNVTISSEAALNLDRESAEVDLHRVSWLINKLREIHYYQIFDPPIRIGILSGYVQARKEKPCSYYPHSNYRKPVQWMLDLKDVKHDNGSNLFHSSLTPISNLSNGE